MSFDEMSVEQIREWSATKVMGWTVYGNYLKHYMGGPAVNSWKPDTDANQLRELLMKACGSDDQKWNRLQNILYDHYRESGEIYFHPTKVALCQPMAVLKALFEIETEL